MHQSNVFAGEKIKVALISVGSNASLVVLKLVAGIAMGSVSVISEAIHSAMDLIASLFAWFAVRESSRPADFQHKFGHGKFENISGLAEALLIFIAAFWIIIEAAHKLLSPAELECAGWGMVVMLVSCAANIWVSRMLFRTAKKTDSMALLADAWHLRADVYTSAGVMFGLLVYWAGEKFVPSVDWKWIDPAAALVVAALILKAAYELTRDSIKDLLDNSLPACEEEGILACARRAGGGKIRFKNLKTRKSGSVRFINLDIEVNPAMSVRSSHELTDIIAASIEKKYEGSSVTVHVEPWSGS